MRDFIKGLFTKEWSIYDKVLCVITAALLGVIAGFMLSPVKKGIRIFNGNGCNIGNIAGKKKGDKK